MSNTHIDLGERINKNLIHLTGKNVVLYGLGGLSSQLIQIKDRLCFNIIAMLDRDLTSSTFYNIPIIDLQSASRYADDILITALGENKHTIFKRIDKQTKCNIWYPNGENPRNQFLSTINYDTLKQKISSFDVISFDLFDTLVLRKCVEPSVVFDILASNYNEPEFPLLRKAASKKAKLNSGKIPTLDKIYSELKSSIKADDELALEKQMLYPRFDMVEIFKYAKALGKTIIITSDMWYDGKTLSKILNNLRIDGFTKIYVSSDYNKSKADGRLWENIIQDYPDQRILHIGDNAESDGLNLPVNITAFIIPQIVDLLGLRPACDIAKTVDDWLTIGHFIDSINCKTKIFAKDLAPFVAPMMFSFIKWLHESTKDEKEILFCARDMYLFYRIWSQLYGNDRIKYLYISRRALGGMLAHNLSVLKRYISFYYDKASSNITVEKAIFRLTGVNTDFGNRNTKDVPVEEIMEHIENNFNLFRNNAIIEHINFEKYMSVNGISSDSAIVDFVCGPSLELLQRLFYGHQYSYGINNNNNPKYDSTKVYSLLNEASNTFVSESDVIKNITFVESLISAPEGSCICFDNNGCPVLAHENIDFSPNDELYESIISFGDTNCSIEVAEKIFGALFCGRYDIKSKFAWSNYSLGKD